MRWGIFKWGLTRPRSGYSLLKLIGMAMGGSPTRSTSSS